MENKQKSNVLKATGIAGIFLGLGYVLFRQYKKSLQVIEKKDEEKVSGMISLGVPADVAKTLVEEDADIIKTAYKLCRYGDSNISISDDAFTFDEVSKDNCPVIHVIKSDKLIGGSARPMVDLIFQLPNYTKMGETIGIGDYITALKELALTWDERFNFDSSKALRGYMPVQYQFALEGDYLDVIGNNLSEPVVDVLEIPASAHAEFATKGRDGLTNMYENFNKTGHLTPATLTAVGETLIDSIEYEITNVYVLHVWLGFKITVPIKRWAEDEGVTAQELAEMIRESYEEFDVMRGNKVKTWDFVMFHPENLNEAYSINGRYAMTKPETNLAQ